MFDTIMVVEKNEILDTDVGIVDKNIIEKNINKQTFSNTMLLIAKKIEFLHNGRNELKANLEKKMTEQ